MGLKRRAFDALYSAADRLLGLDRASLLGCALAEKLHPVARRQVKGTTLAFHAPNELVKWRVDTLLEKEPETIEWIDGFAPGAVLYDVGANIGLYTVYAATTRDCQVLAFEPEAKNYALLNENIRLNGAQRRARAYPLGVSDRDSIDILHLHGLEAGAAMHNIGAAVDVYGQSFIAPFEQGVMTVSLDSFLDRFGAPFPQHVKIDVDGLEPKVIAGMARTLADPRLRSLLLEVNEAEPGDVELAATVEHAGLALVEKRQAPIVAAGHPTLKNYIFRRA